MKKLLFFTTIGLLIDQIIKMVVSRSMYVGQSINLINNFFSLTYVQNEGAAFSILSGNRWLFIICALIVILLIYFVLIKNKKLKQTEIIIYSLLLSGIIGNLIDRLIHGYVIDYLHFNFFGYDFAIFNLADSFIVISIIILIIIEVRENARNNR